MHDLTFLGLNLILLVFAWRAVFKPALRCYVRDQLFDAREELRSTFLASGGLDQPAYFFLRSLLNHHIRFIEDQSLVKIFHFQMALANDTKTTSYIHKKIGRIEDDCGEEFLPIVRAYRKRANRWLKFYLVHSSFCLSAFFYMTVVVAVAVALPEALWRVRRQVRNSVRKTYVRRVDASFDDESVESYPTTSLGQPNFA